MTLRSETILNWLVPPFMAALVAILSWMAINIQEIKVTIYRVDTHEQRLNDHDQILSYIELRAPDQKKPHQCKKNKAEKG